MGDYADGKPYGGHQAHRLIVQADEERKDPLMQELEDAEKAIDDAQERMNGVQYKLARRDCERGCHVFGFYTNPPIGRACVYCQAPAADDAPETRKT